MPITFERVVFTAPAVVTLIDRFAQAGLTRGAFPPPLGPVRFSLIARILQGAAQPLDPLWPLRAETKGDGVFRFRDRVALAGRAPFSIAADRYRLCVESDFYQPLEVDLDWPPPILDSPVFTLDPSYAYPFPDLTLPRTTMTLVRGSVFEVGGGPRPIVDAIVTIAAPANTWPFAACRTDASGGWAVVAPFGKQAQPFPITLHIAPPAGGSLDVDMTLAPGVENSLGQTALRGAVRSATGAPIRGAVVSIDSVTQTAVTDSGGAWSFYLPLDQTDVQALVTATAPGSQSQSQFVDVVARTTVIVPVFSIPIS